MTTFLGFPIQTTIVFVCLLVGALFIDLFTHRKDKVISLRSAILWSVFWVIISLLFAVYLFYSYGSEVGSLFITGYALEKVLSIDNLFVMMAIFSWFSIPSKYWHRILYWGIIGAIIFRGIFVIIGTGLLSLGSYVELIFAFVVGWTAVMMLKNDDNDEEIEDYSQHLAYRLVKRIFPVWPKIYGHNFFINKKQVNEELAKPENKDLVINSGAKATIFATPLFLCLAVIEISDVMFAFDSVPAVIAVSREPLIIYSAMMFAILGLRSMYFVLDALKRYLVHLEKSVMVILFFIALKLFLNATDHLWGHGYNISASTSLIIVLTILALGIIASLLFPSKSEE
ncbi:TerC/Alx family metal homeostasis membrane protein [Frischella perrara]|uniref:TerC/Alx family metal homeostasis membrane protein n=1 Tax=Frischella perrara TaxID=1267021 RepID=UPI0023F03583|nr:TerC/Alx family metal homeostasis membrane protein [Frischella perrara]MCT6875500.1 TerC/Alx family metal homeostasis membrane protein [Frischella perrara]